MKFSLWPNVSHSPADVLELARWADANGWYGVWYADHYMPNTGDTSFAPGDSHECWAMLPAIAAVTTNVRVGPLVSPTSVHHPAVLANRAATLDHVSNGRFVLGLGAGWQINEHHAYGIELEAPGARVTRFEEAIQIVRSLLAEPRTTFAGSVYTVTDAPADPKPVQSPLPMGLMTRSSAGGATRQARPSPASSQAGSAPSVMKTCCAPPSPTQSTPASCVARRRLVSGCPSRWRSRYVSAKPTPGRKPSWTASSPPRW